jgi:hypothetical protein
MPKLIERIGYNLYGTVAYCQLYQGPLCVALGKSRIGSEQAIKNAYSNYKKSIKKENKMNKIVIVVEGGVVQEVYGPENGVEIVIMDYDNFQGESMDNSRERFDLNVDNQIEGLTLIG